MQKKNSRHISNAEKRTVSIVLLCLLSFFLHQSLQKHSLLYDKNWCLLFSNVTIVFKTTYNKIIVWILTKYWIWNETIYLDNSGFPSVCCNYFSSRMTHSYHSLWIIEIIVLSKDMMEMWYIVLATRILQIMLGLSYFHF